MDETSEEPTVPVEPLALIQDAIIATVDDDSLLTGFVVIAEFIEADGRPTMTVVHTPMTPWHLDGLMGYGRAYSDPSQMVPVVDGAWDDDEDDEGVS